MPASYSEYLWNLGTTGSPVVSVVTGVWVKLVNNVSGTGYTSTAKTNSSGQFTINNIPPGTYTVWTSLDGATYTLFGNSNWVVPAGGSDTIQTPAFVSPLTIDASAGEIVIPGVLTGNITINAPTNPSTGQRLTIRFTQDATGSRTVTWNSVFKTAWQAAPAANAISQITFIYDGANWQQFSGEVPVDQNANAGFPGNMVTKSFTAVANGPYSSTAKAGGADYGGAVRIAGGRPWFDWTHPSYGVADPTATAAQNRTAINAAIAAAAAIPGAFVIGPPGNFHIDQAIPVNIAPSGGSYEAGVSIQGMGQGVTTLTQDTANTDVFQVGTTAQSWATNIRIRDLTLGATRYALNLNSSINGLYERITTLNGVSGIFQQGQNERHVFRDIEIENPSGRGIDCKGNANGALITDPLAFPESQKQMFEHIRIYHSSIWGIDYGAGIINAQQQNSGHVTFRHIIFESNLGGDIHISNSFGATIEHCTNEDSFTTNNNVVAFLFELNPGRITMIDCYLSNKSSVAGNFYQYVIQQMDGILVMINVTTANGAGAATADLHVEAEGLALDCMFTLNSIQLVGQGANKFLFIECRYANNTDAYPGVNAMTATSSLGVTLQQLQVLASAEFRQGLDWNDGQNVSNGTTGTGDFVTTQATGRFRFRRTVDNAQILDLVAASRTATFYGPLYPAPPALGSQTTIAIYGGSGAPSNANGNNGDEYHRGDTPATANQRIYNKQAGVWVGIL